VTLLATIFDFSFKLGLVVTGILTVMALYDGTTGLRKKKAVDNEFKEDN
jgi:hypothetical protein